MEASAHRATCIDHTPPTLACNPMGSSTRELNFSDILALRRQSRRTRLVRCQPLVHPVHDLSGRRPDSSDWKGDRVALSSVASRWRRIDCLSDGPRSASFGHAQAMHIVRSE